MTTKKYILLFCFFFFFATFSWALFCHLSVSVSYSKSNRYHHLLRSLLYVKAAIDFWRQKRSINVVVFVLFAFAIKTKILTTCNNAKQTRFDVMFWSLFHFTVPFSSSLSGDYLFLLLIFGMNYWPSHLPVSGGNVPWWLLCVYLSCSCGLIDGVFGKFVEIHSTNAFYGRFLYPSVYFPSIDSIQSLFYFRFILCTKYNNYK